MKRIFLLLLFILPAFHASAQINIPLKGQKGESGLQGPIGNTGPQGERGPQGDPGDTGPQGDAGPAGDSAYEIALDNGFVGTEEEWLESLNGEQGPEGPTGPQGDPGDIGGSGTINYIPKFTPDGVTLGNSLIIDNGTDVGIAFGALQKIGLGTASPAVDCHVVGSQFRLNDGFFFRTDGGNSAEFATPNDLYFYTDVPITSLPSGIGVFNLVGTAVGVRTVSPQRTLDINGELRIRDLITDNPIFLLGADGDGDAARVSLGSGFSYVGTTINFTRNVLVFNLDFSDFDSGSSLIASSGLTPESFTFTSSPFTIEHNSAIFNGRVVSSFDFGSNVDNPTPEFISVGKESTTVIRLTTNYTGIVTLIIEVLDVP